MGLGRSPRGRPADEVSRARRVSLKERRERREQAKKGRTRPVPPVSSLPTSNERG